MLRQAKWNRQRGVKQPEHHPSRHRHPNAAPQGHALINGQPSGEGADDHDPLDPKVQHACAFTDQLAHGCKHQGRGDADHGRPETGRQQDFKNIAHPRTTRILVRRIARTMNNSAEASSISAI